MPLLWCDAAWHNVVDSSEASLTRGFIPPDSTQSRGRVKPSTGCHGNPEAVFAWDKDCRVLRVRVILRQRVSDVRQSRCGPPRGPHSFVSHWDHRSLTALKMEAAVAQVKRETRERQLMWKDRMMKRCLEVVEWEEINISARNGCLNLIQSEAGLGYSVDISSFNRKQ